MEDEKKVADGKLHEVEVTRAMGMAMRVLSLFYPDLVISKGGDFYITDTRALTQRLVQNPEHLFVFLSGLTGKEEARD